MGRLDGKVAIVTGGGGGIGRASAIALAREGARVVVADVDADGASETAAAIGEGALAVPTDVADETAVVAMVAATVRAFGRLDVLHNNAALTAPDVLARDGAVADMTLDVWRRTLDVNLTSQMLCCKHAVPAILAGGGGSIVNMSSGAANIGDVTRVAYGVSKAGVQALTRYVAVAYGKQGIRANAIVPGLIVTPAVTAQVPADMLAIFAADTLTPDVGRPEDVAAMVVFLASDDARYVTGQLLAVDGGITAHGSHYARR